MASALEEKVQMTEHMVGNGTTRAHSSDVLFEEEDGIEDGENENSSQLSNDSVGSDDDKMEQDDQFLNATPIGKLDPDIIMAAEEEENMERCWTRIDPTSNGFLTTGDGSPEWKDVSRRRMMCL